MATKDGRGGSKDEPATRAGARDVDVAELSARRRAAMKAVGGRAPAVPRADAAASAVAGSAAAASTTPAASATGAAHATAPAAATTPASATAPAEPSGITRALGASAGPVPESAVAAHGSHGVQGMAPSLSEGAAPAAPPGTLRVAQLASFDAVRAQALGSGGAAKRLEETSPARFREVLASAQELDRARRMKSLLDVAKVLEGRTTDEINELRLVWKAKLGPESIDLALRAAFPKDLDRIDRLLRGILRRV